MAKRVVSDEAIARIWPANACRIFLGHRSNVKGETYKIKRELKKYGAAGFVAHADIHPTARWIEEIQNALATMDALVALVTEDFHEGSWTDQEVGYGGRIGTYGAWWTGLAWSAARYAPVPQAKAGIAVGAAIGAAATGTGYGFQFYGAYQIYQQTGNPNFLTNSAIGFLLDKSGRLDDVLTPLGSDAGSSAANGAAEYLEGQNGEPLCR